MCVCACAQVGTTYLEAFLEPFTDDKKRNGVDTGVERRHVDAKIVEDQEDAAKRE